MASQKSIKHFSYFIGTALVIIGFQNCSSVMAPDAELEARLANQSSLSNGHNSGSSVLPPPVVGAGIEAQAINILQNKCYACHGAVTNGGVTKINDPAYLISVGQIVPGNATGSLIFDSINAGRMPLGGVQISSTELVTIRDWINAGAKSPSAGATNPVVSIPLAGNFKSIYANVILPKCVGCHSATVSNGGIKLDSYSNVMRYVVAGSTSQSKIYSVSSKGEMPPTPSPMLTSAELKAMSDWILAGAQNN